MAKITSSGPSPLPLLRTILDKQKEDIEAQADVLERIQQQLAQINNHKTWLQEKGLTSNGNFS